MLARHVSELTGPSSGVFYKLYLQIWYVVICVILGTSSRYEVVYCLQAINADVNLVVVDGLYFPFTDHSVSHFKNGEQTTFSSEIYLICKY